VTANVKELIAAGSYSTAINLLTQTINMLYSSTGYKKNDPQVMSQIAALVEMLKQAEQANPGAQASAAQATAAYASYSAALKNTDTAVSIPAAASMVSSVHLTVSRLIAMGSFSVASSILVDTLQQLYSSPAANSPEVKALIASIIALHTNISTIALQSTDMASSIAASKHMAKSTLSTVQDMLASGSFSNAIDLIIHTTNLLYNSIGYKNRDPSVLQEIALLTQALKDAQMKNPGTQASAAVAAAAQASYISALQNTDTSVSVSAAKNLVSLVQSTVSTLIAMGSFSSASVLIRETLKQLRASPVASNPEITSLIESLTSLQAIVIAANPESSESELLTEADVTEQGEQVDYGEKNSYGDNYGEKKSYGDNYGDTYGPKPYGDTYGQVKQGGSKRSSRKKTKKRRKTSNKKK
jgi:Arc/MetJ-type ribon-helix-helix transcriptional regulator